MLLLFLCFYLIVVVDSYGDITNTKGNKIFKIKSYKWNAQITNFTFDYYSYNTNLYMKKVFHYLKDRKCLLNSFIKNDNNNTMLLEIECDKIILNNIKDNLNFKFGINNIHSNNM